VSTKENVAILVRLYIIYIASPEAEEKITLEFKSLIVKLQEQNNTVFLQWIPAHCNFNGNEKADFLAKMGSKKKQHINHVSHQSIKTHIKGISEEKIPGGIIWKAIQL
jgi:hypothetical protein